MELRSDPEQPFFISRVPSEVLYVGLMSGIFLQMTKFSSCGPRMFLPCEVFSSFKLSADPSLRLTRWKRVVFAMLWVRT